MTILVVWTKGVFVLAQWTPSRRMWNVPAVLPGRVGLLSNPSGDPSSLTCERCQTADAGAVNGSVTGTVGWGDGRREQLSLVDRLPKTSAPDPTVTVVICAHSEDRWDDLVAAVTSVKQQTYRPAEIMLVIDHNPKLQSKSNCDHLWRQPRSSKLASCLPRKLGLKIHITHGKSYEKIPS